MEVTPQALVAGGLRFESLPLRGLEGVPGLPGAPQDEAGLTRKFETSLLVVSLLFPKAVSLAVITASRLQG